MVIRIVYLFLILLFTSCEELDINEDSIFEADPSLQIPEVTSIYESINGSSANFSWDSNDFAMEFSFKLEAVSLDGLNDITNLLVDQPYYEWGDWSRDPWAYFDNLDEGEYTFYVKSRFDYTEEEEPKSKIFQIENNIEPSLRIYPRHQTVNNGDTINVYLLFEDIGAADTPNPVNLFQVDISFTSWSSGSNTVVELNGEAEVQDLSSLLYCNAANNNPLDFFITNSQNNDSGGFNMTIMKSFIDDNGDGLCGIGPLVRIPLWVDGDFSITISNGNFQYYDYENDEFYNIYDESNELMLINGSVTVE